MAAGLWRFIRQKFRITIGANFWARAICLETWSAPLKNATCAWSRAWICNWAYEEAFKAHPEWFERNRDGSPRNHGESPWLYKTCMFGAYFTEQMPAIYREINRRYPVDGFFTNGWPSTGTLEVCYCESCQKLYREKVGGVPPAESDATNPFY